MAYLTNEYVFFAGKRVARRDASGNIYYYAEDFIGSSRVITQSNGTLCSDADFLPFGQEVDFTSACGQNYKFEGKERDLETGNDNFGARYYRSALGRWMSPDWSAIPEPVPYANLTNPQTLNLYAMVSDNPEAFADLDGHTGGILEMIAEEGGFGPDIITGSDAYTDGTDTVISLAGSPPPVPILPTTPPQSPTGVTAQQQNQTNNVPSKFVIETSETENKKFYSVYHYQLQNSKGKALTGDGYSVEEHIDSGHTSVSQETSEGQFKAVVHGEVLDRVGKATQPPKDYKQDSITYQTFTVRFKGTSPLKGWCTATLVAV